jgi:hypothetical protein
MMNVTQAFRGSILYFTGDPLHDHQPVIWHEDGLLLLNGELIVASGAYADLRDNLPEDLCVTDYSGKSSCPGLLTPMCITRKPILSLHLPKDCCPGWRPIPFPRKVSLVTMTTHRKLHPSSWMSY